MATQKNREQLPRVVTRLKCPPAPQNSDSAIIPELQNEQVLMGGGEVRTGEERRGANYCSIIITAAAEDVVLTYDRTAAQQPNVVREVQCIKCLLCELKILHDVGYLIKCSSYQNSAVLIHC